MKFPFTIHTRTAVGLLAALAVVGSVAASAEKIKSVADLTSAEIEERLQVNIRRRELYLVLFLGNC